MVPNFDIFFSFLTALMDLIDSVNDIMEANGDGYIDDIETLFDDALFREDLLNQDIVVGSESDVSEIVDFTLEEGVDDSIKIHDSDSEVEDILDFILDHKKDNLNGELSREADVSDIVDFMLENKPDDAPVRGRRGQEIKNLEIRREDLLLLVNYRRKRRRDLFLEIEGTIYRAQIRGHNESTVGCRHLYISYKSWRFCYGGKYYDTEAMISKFPLSSHTFPKKYHLRRILLTVVDSKPKTVIKTRVIKF